MLLPENSSRVFLVVIDESPELRAALHFACLRARHDQGRIALLTVIEPGDIQHFGALDDLMRQERREAAEKRLQALATEAEEWSGNAPLIYLREGQLRDELIKIIETETSISILVLGANTGPDGPGPLLTQLVGKFTNKLRIPITIVPGNLSDEALAAIT